jgi:hypothetical protein
VIQIDRKIEKAQNSKVLHNHHRNRLRPNQIRSPALRVVPKAARVPVSFDVRGKASPMQASTHQQPFVNDTIINNKQQAQ